MYIIRFALNLFRERVTLTVSIPWGRFRPTTVAAGLILLLLLASVLVACGSSSSSSESTDASASSSAASGSETSTATSDAFPVTITDDNGDTVTIESAPENIVSTSVTLTGMLLAIDAPVSASAGAGEGTDLATEDGFFKQWSDVAEERDVTPLWHAGSEPSVETVLAEDPDLIVVSLIGGDSAMDILAQLRDVAPTIVIDYGSQSWQDAITKLGEATGRTAQAEQVIADFDASVAEAREAITVPEGTISAFFEFADGGTTNLATAESPQAQLLVDLGFTLAEVPESVIGVNTSMGNRRDIIQLSPETVVEGLNGDTWIVLAPSENSERFIETSPQFAAAPAVQNDAIYYMGADSFRLDPYSAANMVESVKSQFS